MPFCSCHKSWHMSPNNVTSMWSSALLSAQQSSHVCPHDWMRGQSSWTFTSRRMILWICQHKLGQFLSTLGIISTLIFSLTCLWLLTRHMGCSYSPFTLNENPSPPNKSLLLFSKVNGANVTCLQLKWLCVYQLQLWLTVMKMWHLNGRAYFHPFYAIMPIEVKGSGV